MGYYSGVGILERVRAWFRRVFRRES